MQQTSIKERARALESLLYSVPNEQEETTAAVVPQINLSTNSSNLEKEDLNSKPSYIKEVKCLPLMLALQ